MTSSIKPGSPAKVREMLDTALAPVPRVPNCSGRRVDALAAATLALSAIFGDTAHGVAAAVSGTRAVSATRAVSGTSALGLGPFARGDVVVTAYDARFRAASGLGTHSELFREWPAIANLAGAHTPGVHLPLRGAPFKGDMASGKGRGVLYHL